MNIALFCTTDFPFPLPSNVVYAPMPLFAGLAQGLAERGHRIFLYAPANSRFAHPNITHLSHDLVSYDQAGFENKWGPFADQDVVAAYEQMLAAHILEDSRRYGFEIVHFYHNITRHLPLLKDFPLPCLATLHDPIADKKKFIFEKCTWRNGISCVSISNGQRKGMPNLKYADTIYNGIDLSLYPPAGQSEKYFTFVGRVSREKGVHTAVKVAREMGVPLKIIGPLWSSGEYFDTYIRPYLSRTIEYLDFLPPAEIRPILSKSEALLFPVEWEEPFGLTMIEALACGTPVIAFKRGSVPEIVEDGKTGFVVESEKEMKDAIRKIDKIDRERCRKAAETRFSLETMVDRYEQLYRSLIKKV